MFSSLEIKLLLGSIIDPFLKSMKLFIMRISKATAEVIVFSE